MSCTLANQLGTRCSCGQSFRSLKESSLVLKTGASTGTRKFHNGALNHEATCDSPSTRSSPHRSQHTAASIKYVFKSQGFSGGRARYFSPWLAPVVALIRFPVPFTDSRSNSPKYTSTTIQARRAYLPLLSRKTAIWRPLVDGMLG